MSDHPTPAPRAPEAERPTGPTRKCDICTLPLSGVMIGNGDGSGQCFAHPECYYRERAKAAESRARAAEEDLERVRGALSLAVQNMRAWEHWACCRCPGRFTGSRDFIPECQCGYDDRKESHDRILQDIGAAHPTQGEERT